MSPNARQGADRKNRLRRLKGAVRELGSRAIDRRTTIGKALTSWRGELVHDLGGPDTISTQQAAIIELAVKTKLMLDSVDAWIFRQPSLVDKRRRAVLPVVRERQQLADALSRYMTQLGLQRRQPPPKNLNEFLAERYGPPSAENDRGSAPTTKPRPSDPCRAVGSANGSRSGKEQDRQ